MTMLSEALEWVERTVARGMNGVEHDGRKYVRGEGGQLIEVKGTNPPLPDHIVQNVTLTDIASFVAYVEDFKAENSRIFVSLSDRCAIAALDYHDRETVRRASHNAVLRFRIAPEWITWTGCNGKLIDQRAFAEFIERNIKDVLEPDAGVLFDIISNIEGKRELSFKSSYRTSDGTRRIIFDEDQDTSGNEMTVPNKIVLNIPFLYLEERYRVEALLRHRIDEGKLKFRLDFVDHEHVERDAMLAAQQRIAEATELPVHVGCVG